MTLVLRAAIFLTMLWTTACAAPQAKPPCPEPLAVAATAPSPNTQVTSSIRPTTIDWISPLRVERIDKPSAPTINWSTVISSLLAAFVGVGGAVLVGWWSQRGIQRSLAQSANAAELKELQVKLDTFYGPHMQLSEVNRLLAEEFKSQQKDPASFRTFTLLLDPQWRERLSKSDQTIVGEIVKNDVALNGLICKSSGLVDSQVASYLSRAAAHFRIIQLAFKGRFDNLPERLDRYVYPKQLDQVLRLEIKRLTDRCETLRGNAAKSIGAMPPLTVPRDLELPAWPSVDNISTQGH